jgi:hypothetical protein
MKPSKVLAFAILFAAIFSAITALAESFCTTNGAYVVIPDSASVNITNNALTVECWFKRNALVLGYDPWNSLVSKEANSYTFQGWDLRFGRQQVSTCIQMNPQSVVDTSTYLRPGSGEPNTNQWHHYAMQYDGTNYFVWIDGTRNLSSNCTAQIVNTTNPVHIGCQYAGWRLFPGWIAEVRVSNVARYNTPFTPQTRFVTDSQTLALYHFDEGQGTIVSDSSGNGNTGTIQGSGAWSTDTPIPIIQIGLIKALKPSFSGLLIGTNYQLQVSAGLNTWTNQGAPFTASGPTMVYPQYWDVDNWGQLFFRLQVAP